MEPWEAARAELAGDACVVGVDEVGRGPLAGDVVAAAVVLAPAPAIEGLTDSKKLSPSQRQRISRELHASQARLALGRASPGEIDELNILRASLLAMRRAVDALQVDPDLVLVDGRHLPDWSYRAHAVVRGDSRVAEIAAASIIAKVQRDAEMAALHERWPQYGFDQHMGYPTARHLDALREHGPCPVHRRSFAPVRAALGSTSEEN
jgi:ribonuclease HII